jgi:hypothetical protein
MMVIYDGFNELTTTNLQKQKTKWLINKMVEFMDRIIEKFKHDW